VSRALLSGLVFIKGVPLEFRSDNAPELMHGLVAAMNHYLGVEQITTGGYNPRGNAIVERFTAKIRRDESTRQRSGSVVALLRLIRVYYFN
jgi:hypothetical protein